MKKIIVTQGCFLLLCSMFANNGFGDEPGVAHISNRQAKNIERAIFETKPNGSTQVKKAGFLSTVRSKLTWKSNKNDCCTTTKKCCTTKNGCCDKKGACCDTKGNCCKTKNGCCNTKGGCNNSCNNGTNCCKGNGCGQAGCNSCNGSRGLKRFFSFGKCSCGCGQRGCGCSSGGLFGRGGNGCGNGRTLCAPWGHYSVVYPVDPFYFDRRDSKLYSAQGYGSPVSVPLAPNVRQTYNYGWGIPSSRLTPISRPGYHTQVLHVGN